MGNSLIDCKRVLIIHPEGNSYNNPSLKCIISLFKENNVLVDIRFKKSNAPMPKTQGVRLIPYGLMIASVKFLFVKFLSSFYLTFGYVYIERMLLYKKYDLIIGVDRQGLIEASLLSNITNVPYMFISFEIMFESETSSRYKRIERLASKNVSLWVAQDEIRSHCLRLENFLHKERSFILPLASEGEGVQSSKRLRDTLGIPVCKKVAIVIGSIAQWSMTNSILESLSRWPDEWVLIIHDRYGRTAELLSSEIDFPHDLVNCKLFISDFAAEMVDDMGYILAGVSVGLAFYSPDHSCPHTGNNLRYLGLASGKISTYLRYGVPIIANQIGLLAEHATKYQFGLVVGHPNDLPASLGQIDVERMKINAIKYFSEKLDFKLYRNLLWDAMASAIAR